MLGRTFLLTSLTVLLHCFAPARRGSLDFKKGATPPPPPRTNGPGAQHVPETHWKLQLASKHGPEPYRQLRMQLGKHGPELTRMCQKECQKRCQIECEIQCKIKCRNNICQIDCQNICQIECQNKGQIECQVECQMKGQNRMSEDYTI